VRAEPLAGTVRGIPSAGSRKRPSLQIGDDDRSSCASTSQSVPTAITASTARVASSSQEIVPRQLPSF
jgi:hypothetical protein